MINNSIFKGNRFNSRLLTASTLKPRGSGRSKKLLAGITLTSLIDAFSILVIYLLMNFSNSGEILLVGDDIILPAAARAAELERATVIKLQKGQIFVEDKFVQADTLVSILIEKKKELAKKKTNPSDEFSLIIQADKRTIYKRLSQVIQAGAHAGFGEIKFAVLVK